MITRRVAIDTVKQVNYKELTAYKGLVIWQLETPIEALNVSYSYMVELDRMKLYFEAIADAKDEIDKIATPSGRHNYCILAHE